MYDINKRASVASNDTVVQYFDEQYLKLYFWCANNF